MRIHTVSVEESLMSLGIRKMSGFIKTLNADTHSFYVPLGNVRSFRQILRGRYEPGIQDEQEARRMAEPIAEADIVAFSSMTNQAAVTKALIQQVRWINPSAYIIWGGIHPIIVPEDAVKHADAICAGEGEFAFAEFFEAFCRGRDYTETHGLWFNRGGKIIRNKLRPLMTSAEMDQLPLLKYGQDEQIYVRTKGRYREMTKWDYVDYVGLAYNTIWTIGCPFKCTYCGNTKFIENDRAYTRLRHPAPEWIVREISAARRVHPHLCCVIFHDDSFLALPPKTIEEFARIYKRDVGLPFAITGVIPNYVKRDKLEILLEAGMNRVRMGIQSGSQRILDFYKRPSPPAKILQAVEILGDYSRYMIPPAYDLILDNPIEIRQDAVDTLELAYTLRRPFTLNLFSLRVMPNTDLAKQFSELGISAHDLERNSYADIAPTLANCVLVLLALVRPPRWVMDRLVGHVRAPNEPQRRFPWTLLTLRFLFFAKRGWSHFRVMDYSVIPGRSAWLLWRTGIVQAWRRCFVRRYRRPTARSDESSKPIAAGPASLPLSVEAAAPVGQPSPLLVSLGVDAVAPTLLRKSRTPQHREIAQGRHGSKNSSWGHRPIRRS